MQADRWLLVNIPGLPCAIPQANPVIAASVNPPCNAIASHPTCAPCFPECSKGKVDAFRLLQQKLAQQMQVAFPDVAADYQQLRHSDAATAAAAGASQPAAATAPP
jgi:hypothetical protein